MRSILNQEQTFDLTSKLEDVVSDKNEIEKIIDCFSDFLMESRIIHREYFKYEK